MGDVPILPRDPLLDPGWSPAHGFRRPKNGSLRHLRRQPYVHDPGRVRIRCQAPGCWSEAHETRDLRDVLREVTRADPIVHVCPRHAAELDVEMYEARDADERIRRRVADLAEVGSRRVNAVATAATAQDAPQEAETPDPHADATDDAEPAARPNARRAELGVAGYVNRSKAHGEERRKLPSRSPEARHREYQRRVRRMSTTVDNSPQLEPGQSEVG